MLFLLILDLLSLVQGRSKSDWPWLVLMKLWTNEAFCRSALWLILALCLFFNFLLLHLLLHFFHLHHSPAPPSLPCHLLCLLKLLLFSLPNLLFIFSIPNLLVFYLLPLFLFFLFMILLLILLSAPVPSPHPFLCPAPSPIPSLPLLLILFHPHGSPELR